MDILVSGSSGLIGSALVPSLTAHGHRVSKLVRQNDSATVPTWDPAGGKIDLASAGPFDAVVHLAGESIAQRWSREAKRRIRESRVPGTRLLSETLAKLPQPPKVLVCASACGFYGHRGSEWLDETSPPGAGFLAEVSRDWEAAAKPAVERGIRVVQLRFGIVLAANGGALRKMLPAFKLGLGGKLGDGRAYWSWIEIGDVVNAIQHALVTESLRGPVNAVTPNPVTNLDFTKMLGRVLCRPTIFAMPRTVVESLFGEMGREVLLASFRVGPAKLLASGFQFQWPDLEPALRHVLAQGRTRR